MYKAGHSVGVQSKHYRELVHSSEAAEWFAVKPAAPVADGGAGVSNVVAFKPAA